MRVTDSPATLRAASFSQVLASQLYSVARDAYAQGLPGSALAFAEMGAEVSMHARWLLGIEDACTCDRHLVPL